MQGKSILKETLSEPVLKEVLISSSIQLQSMARLKEKLFINIIHDLRNPFASMVSMMEVLENDFCSSDSREILCEVKKQVKSTYLLVDRLLDRADNPETGKTAGAVSSLVQKTVTELQKVKIGGAEIINSSDACTAVLAERTLLPSALEVIFDFSEQIFLHGALISVQIRLTGQKVIIIIRDTGIEIEINEAKRLFEAEAPGILIPSGFLAVPGIEARLTGIIEKGSTLFFAVPWETVII